MSRASVSLTLAFSALIGALTLSVEGAAAPTALSAAEIVDKNIAARGGLVAWRGVQTLSWSGKMDAGGHVKQAAAGEPASVDAAKTGPEAAKVGPRAAG